MSAAIVAAAMVFCVGAATSDAKFPDWKQIGSANNVSAMAAWKGMLYVVTTDNKLYVRPASAATAPWRRIDHAYNGAALAAVNGYLYMATKDNKLWRRRAVPTKDVWKHISHAFYAKGLAGNGTELWGLTSQNKLWVTSTTGAIKWRHVGHGYHAEAMTSYGGRLYATTSQNLIWSRNASGGNVAWDKIGSANNTTGIAISSGVMFVTTSDNKLWATAMVATSQHANGVLLQSQRSGFYMRDSGGYLKGTTRSQAAATRLRFIQQRDGSFAIQSGSSGRYLYDPANNSPARLNAARVGAGEKFYIHPLGNETVAIRTLRTNKYFYDGTGGRALIGNAARVGAGEKFVLHKAPAPGMRAQLRFSVNPWKLSGGACFAYLGKGVFNFAPCSNTDNWVFRPSTNTLEFTSNPWHIKGGACFAYVGKGKFNFKSCADRYSRTWRYNRSAGTIEYTFNPWHIKGGSCFTYMGKGAFNFKSCTHKDARMWRITPTGPIVPAAVASSSAPSTSIFPKYTSAQYRRKWPCPPGQFHDPRKGGECWTCPSGYARTIWAVNGTSACEKTTGGTFRASKHGRGTGLFRTDCRGGQFWDGWSGGWCWSCPNGNRTLAPIYASNACAQRSQTYRARASYRGKAGCKSGTFHDPRKGGECWSCPTGYNRTAFHAVNTKRACHRRTSGACSMVFNEVKDLLPASTAAQVVGGCYISFVEGMTCTLLPAIGQLAPPPTQSMCSKLTIGVKQACSFVMGNVLGVLKGMKCINKVIAAVKTRGHSIRFVPANLSNSLCKSAGGLFTTYMISKRLKGAIKAHPKRKRLNALLTSFEKNKVLKGGIKALTAFKVAMQACVDAL